MKYNQDDVVKMVVAKTGINAKTVHNILCETEEVVFNCLSCASPDNDVEIKPLKGIIIHSRYLPSREFRSGTFNGMTAEKIKAKAKVTTHFNDKLNGKL